jgi:hypothetical protein
MKTLFIAWEHYHARTSRLGRALGAEVHYVYRLGRVSGPRLMLKYLLQSVDTVAILARERPEVVIVQTPPVFGALLATLYALLFPATRVILDAHSGTFLSPKWTWSLGLQRWCSRRAEMTIVHMASLVPVVERWGAPAMELGYVFETGAPATEPSGQLVPGTNIVVPCSFNADEPVELVFEAARRLPDVTFHLTGKAERMPAAYQRSRPDNVRLTGYLSVPAYLGLLSAADAVLALTTQDQTFQTGGAEAVWLARPLILSDWPELRQVFTRGTVFVPHTVEGLVAGVRVVQARQGELAADMRGLKGEFDRSLQMKYRRLRAVIYGAAPRQTPRSDWAADQERVE